MAAAVDGSFKEATTGEIDLEEGDPEIVKLMLDFLYLGTYQDGSGAQDSAAFGSDPLKNNSSEPSSSLSSSAPTSNSSSTTHSGSISDGTPAAPQATVNSPFRDPSPSGAGAQPVSFGGSRTPSNAPNIFGFGTASQRSNATSRFSSDEFGFRATARPQSTGLFGSARTTSFGETQSSIFGSPLTPEQRDLITHAKVYILAEQYDIQPLKHLAKTKYEVIVSAVWNSPSFTESLLIIYDGTPESVHPDMLRALVLSTAGKNSKELMDRGEFVALCRERRDIATDILKASFAIKEIPQPASTTPKTVRCRNNPTHPVI